MRNFKYDFIGLVAYIFVICFYTFNFVLFIVVPNIMAFIKEEDMSMDLGIFSLKSGFIKFLIICVDIVSCYFLYKYLADWFKAYKKKISTK